MPDLVSRVIVHVMLAKATSTSPDCTAGRRCAGARLTNFTLLASPNTAAAIARHESASMPRITPWLSGSEKLAELPITPQVSTPRAFTAASVGELVGAAAGAEAGVCASAPAVASPPASSASDERWAAGVGLCIKVSWGSSSAGYGDFFERLEAAVDVAG